MIRIIIRDKYLGVGAGWVTGVNLRLKRKGWAEISICLGSNSGTARWNLVWNSKSRSHWLPAPSRTLGAPRMSGRRGCFGEARAWEMGT